MMSVETRAEEIMEAFKQEFGDGINDIRLDIYRDGVKKRPCPNLWIRMKRERFHDSVKYLSTFGQIHNSVASGSDKGDEIEVLYHLSLYFDEKYGEITVTLGLSVPKDDPHYPTITNVVPGALPTEREKQEFLGVVVDGIPDPRKMWLLESNLPDGMYPWRKDETGPEGLVSRVHEFDKPKEHMAPEEEPEPWEPEPVDEPSDGEEMDTGEGPNEETRDEADDTTEVIE